MRDQKSRADASKLRRKNPKATNSLLEAKLALPALKAAMRDQKSTADASKFRRRNPKATNSLLEVKLALPALKAAMRDQKSTADASKFRRRNPKATNSLLEVKSALPALKAAMRVAPIQSAYLIRAPCQGKIIKKCNASVLGDGARSRVTAQSLPFPSQRAGARPRRLRPSRTADGLYGSPV